MTALLNLTQKILCHFCVSEQPVNDYWAIVIHHGYILSGICILCMYIDKPCVLSVVLIVKKHVVFRYMHNYINNKKKKSNIYTCTNITSSDNASYQSTVNGPMNLSRITYHHVKVPDNLTSSAVLIEDQEYWGWIQTNIIKVIIWSIKWTFGYITVTINQNKARLAKNKSCSCNVHLLTLTDDKLISAWKISLPTTM